MPSPTPMRSGPKRPALLKALLDVEAAQRFLQRSLYMDVAILDEVLQEQHEAQSKANGRNQGAFGYFGRRKDKHTLAELDKAVERVKGNIEADKRLVNNIVQTANNAAINLNNALDSVQESQIDRETIYKNVQAARKAFDVDDKAEVAPREYVIGAAFLIGFGFYTGGVFLGHWLLLLLEFSVRFSGVLAIILIQASIIMLGELLKGLLRLFGEMFDECMFYCIHNMIHYCTCQCCFPVNKDGEREPAISGDFLFDGFGENPIYDAMHDEYIGMASFIFRTWRKPWLVRRLSTIRSIRKALAPIVLFGGGYSGNYHVHVIPIAKLIDLKAWPIHEDALQDDIVQSITLSDLSRECGDFVGNVRKRCFSSNPVWCCFVSHRWLSFPAPTLDNPQQTISRPDDDQNTLLHKVKAHLGLRNDMTEEEIFKLVESGKLPKYVWLDYTCCPQSSSGVSNARKQLALRTIPAILRSSRVIVVHATENAEQNYPSRVWCQVELMGAPKEELTPSTVVPPNVNLDLYVESDIFKVVPSFLFMACSVRYWTDFFADEPRRRILFKVFDNFEKIYKSVADGKVLQVTGVGVGDDPSKISNGQLAAYMETSTSGVEGEHAVHEKLPPTQVHSEPPVEFKEGAPKVVEVEMEDVEVGKVEVGA